MKCPYCAEEIQPDAVKCKHCGEWLDRSRAPVSSLTSTQAGHLDNSRINLYTPYLEAPNLHPPPKILIIQGENEAEVRAIIEKKYPGWNIAKKNGIRIKNPGKYSCPNCRYKYTKCEKNIGCAIWIIIFISLGIGLIMIPFLPYNCKCELCGYAWKA